MSKKLVQGWIPGVLSKSQLTKLCNEGLIEDVENVDRASDTSSIDLCITNEAYRMTKGSVKPFGSRYLSRILDCNLAEEQRPDPGEADLFTLKPKKTYLFRLREKIPKLGNKGIYGQATARSTIGRVDVLARLIVDGMNCYEYFDPEGLGNGNGNMYLEITPITFTVRVKEGTPLTQLRLFVSKPENVEMKGKEIHEACLISEDGKEGEEGFLSIDLSRSANYSENICAFVARDKRQLKPIDLWTDKGSGKPDPRTYWVPLDKDEERELTIEKTYFYILRSKERIRLSPGVAVYCRASDETIGEMRIHYAGFVHPWFGYERRDGKEGTPLTFEVRGHDVDVVLRHGERMANLVFYRMSEDSKESEKSYNEQELQLSRLFQDWPTLIAKNEDNI